MTRKGKLLFPVAMTLGAVLVACMGLSNTPIPIGSVPGASSAPLVTVSPVPSPTFLPAVTPSPLAAGDSSQRATTQQSSVTTPMQATEAISTLSLSACVEDRIAFKVVGSNIKEGIYLACPDNGTIELVVDTTQHKTDIVELEDISRQNDAILLKISNHESFSSVMSMNLANFSYTAILGLEDNRNAYWVRWSPDTKFIGYATAAQGDDPGNPTSIQFLQVDMKTFSQIQPEASSIQYFDWSSASGMILYLGGDGLHTPSTFLAHVNCDNSTGRCEASDTHIVPNVGGEPSFSYDATSIVSIVEREGHPRGYIRITDLSGYVVHDIAIHQLDPDVGHAYYPSLSRDGTRVAFVADSLTSGIENIYVIDLKSMTLLNLTGNTQQDVYYGSPKW